MTGVFGIDLEAMPLHESDNIGTIDDHLSVDAGENAAQDLQPPPPRFDFHERFQIYPVQYEQSYGASENALSHENTQSEGRQSPGRNAGGIVSDSVHATLTFVS